MDITEHRLVEFHFVTALSVFVGINPYDVESSGPWNVL
jgi:hypothetical protein